MKPKSCIIAGYYGYGNAGDELILHSLIRQYRQENSHLVITVLSAKPQKTAASFGVHAVNRWYPLTWVGPFFKAQRFILGGGGLLQESTGPWNHLYYLSLLVLAKLFRCRTEVEALGVDPIRKPANRFLTRVVMNHAVDFLSVRDAVSRQALSDSGVVFPITIGPDPVFNLNVQPSSSAPDGIALAVSPSKRPGWISELVSLGQRLFNYLHVPVDLIVFFPAEDEALAHAISGQCPAIRQVRVWQNPDDLLSWIPQYQVIASTRFHALVLAARSNIPFIGWGSQYKVAALCQEREMPYANTEEKWDEDEQFRTLVAVYQSRNKSVILETRTA